MLTSVYTYERLEKRNRSHKFLEDLEVDGKIILEWILE
jgi:hypothetical protein